jgi:hypothetical protein
MIAALWARALVCFAAPSKRWSRRQKPQWSWLGPPCRPCADKAIRRTSVVGKGNDRQVCAPRKTSNRQSVPVQTSAGAAWELAQPVRPWLLRNCGRGAPGDGEHFVDCDPHIPEQGPAKADATPTIKFRAAPATRFGACNPAEQSSRRLCTRTRRRPRLAGRPRLGAGPAWRQRGSLSWPNEATRAAKKKITPGARDRRLTTDADAQSRDQVRLGQVYQRPRQP